MTTSASNGSVPSPNAAILKPPCHAEPLLKAYKEALYTSPHGSQPHSIPTPTQAGTNRSLTRSLWVMVAGSFAFGFALVPLYDVICEAAGIRVNAAPSAIQASAAGAGREVTLEFMSMIPPGSAFELP